MIYITDCDLYTDCDIFINYMYIGGCKHLGMYAYRNTILLGPHLGSVPENDMKRRCKNKKKLKTLSTRGANNQFVD